MFEKNKQSGQRNNDAENPCAEIFKHAKIYSTIVPVKLDLEKLSSTCRVNKASCWPLYCFKWNLYHADKVCLGQMTANIEYFKMKEIHEKPFQILKCVWFAECSSLIIIM